MVYNKALSRHLGVALYGPTDSKPYFRLSGPDGDRYSVRLPKGYLVRERDGRDDEFVAEQRRWAEEQFTHYVNWVEATGHESTQLVRSKARTVNDLCDRREEELERLVLLRERSVRTLENAKDTHRLYIRPLIGSVRLSDWDVEHSVKVMQEARSHLGAYAIQRVGAHLRALVTLGHQGRNPWMPRTNDPMYGVDYSLRRPTQTHGEDVTYVPPRYRPTTAQLEALRSAMGVRARDMIERLAARPRRPVTLDRDWGELLVGFLGYTGARAGEGMALTVRSVLGHDRDTHQVWIHQAAVQAARASHASYGFTKDRRRRFAVVQPEIWGPLVARCEQLLDRFGEEQGMAALLFPAHDHNLVWVEHITQAEREAWEGGPGRWVDQDLWGRSQFWHSLFKPAALAACWPDVLDFNSCRHHFATWAHHVKGWSIDDISRLMGHASTDITMRRYFISSDDANSRLIGEFGAAS